MIALVVRFELLPDHEAAFDELVEEALAGIRIDEPGTLVYASHAVEDPDVRVFYECYVDRAAFDAHEQQPHTRRFLEARAEHLSAAPKIWWLTPRPGAVLGAV
ncbi:putative quinol monooxygenase [Jatrophihabitans sp.]|uniref:putative quinol monooxygenase n=1 Tax=Jatrophihabitans sp. TaxID=1932789 RepID=UPI0030C691A6|nr:hypothetical protein [Jatrophihabitans sp.]